MAGVGGIGDGIYGGGGVGDLSANVSIVMAELSESFGGGFGVADCELAHLVGINVEGNRRLRRKRKLPWDRLLRSSKILPIDPR